MRFSVEEHGFSKHEVESALEIMENQMKEQKNRIFSLKNENENLLKELEELKQIQANQFSNALEKLKEAETENHKIVTTKTSQIEELLSKWRKLIASLYEKYPFIKNIGSFRDGIEEFEEKIKETLSQTRKSTRMTSQVKTSNDSMRALLEKLNKVTWHQPQPKVIRMDRLSTLEKEELAETPVQIKPITKLELNKDDKFETLLEKFMEAETENLGILEKHLINSPDRGAKPDFGETGFSLKEAVNPKDDLEEIMKAFDFFSEC